MALDAPSRVVNWAVDQVGKELRSLSDKLDSVTERPGVTGKYEYLDDRPKYYCKLTMSKYNRQDLMTIGHLDPQADVILPLPLNIIDPHQVDFQEGKLGFLGGAATQGALSKGASKLGAAGVAGAFSAAGALDRLPSTLFGRGGSTAGVLGSVVGGATAPGQALFGVSPNEFFTLLLKGPKYKRHSLKWKLSPRTFQESSKLRQIINLLNNATAVGTAAGGLIWSFPMIFEIMYMPNPGYLMKFKPAVCEAFVTNFSAGGAPSMLREGKSGERISGSNNPPESVDIEMRFIELEYWITGQFKDNNIPESGYGIYN